MQEKQSVFALGKLQTNYQTEVAIADNSFRQLVKQGYDKPVYSSPNVTNEGESTGSAFATKVSKDKDDVTFSGTYVAPQVAPTFSQNAPSSQQQIVFQPNITIVVEGEIDAARIKDVLVDSLSDSNVAVKIAKSGEKGQTLRTGKK